MAKKSKSRRNTRRRKLTRKITNKFKPPKPRLRFSAPSINPFASIQGYLPVRNERVLPARSAAKTSRKKAQRKYLATKVLTQDRKQDKLHCVNRSIRKEVMHAINKTGQSGQKRPTWTEDSRKRC
jgi:hypothetical protein